MALYRVMTTDAFWAHQERWPAEIYVFFRAALQIHRQGAAEAQSAGATYLIPSAVAIWVEDHHAVEFESAAQQYPDIVSLERAT
jgi:hypothetical protein